jgi:hypothetical protein
MLGKILALIVLFFILIFGYGYWHVSSYGWLYISLYDMAEKDRKYEQIKKAKILLLDYNGNVLARGKSDSRNGVVYLSHPEVGFCVEEESKAPFSKKDRQNWYDCYEKQAKWCIDWARNVKYIDLAFDKCIMKRIPVTVSESKDDWWLWWVPHPHIGGKPSTYFSINIQVDSSNCTRVSP